MDASFRFKPLISCQSQYVKIDVDVMIRNARCGKRRRRETGIVVTLKSPVRSVGHELHEL